MTLFATFFGSDTPGEQGSTYISYSHFDIEMKPQ
jgi:hypothetical protein